MTLICLIKVIFFFNIRTLGCPSLESYYCMLGKYIALPTYLRIQLLKQRNCFIKKNFFFIGASSENDSVGWEFGRDRGLASSSQEGSWWSPGRSPEVWVWYNPDPSQGRSSPQPHPSAPAALKSLLSRQSTTAF